MTLIRGLRTIALIALAMAIAGCGTGYQVAAGPVVGYVTHRGLSAGWEAGGGLMQTPDAGGDPTPSAASLLARASAGMSWQADPARARLERITHIAWEPWLLVGGTVGVAHSSADGSLHPLGGFWEAVPYVVGAPVRATQLRTCSPCYTVSLAIGWRFWGSGSSEFYLAPKFGILENTKMPWPFQTYAD